MHVPGDGLERPLAPHTPPRDLVPYDLQPTPSPTTMQHVLAVLASQAATTYQGERAVGSAPPASGDIGLLTPEDESPAPLPDGEHGRSVEDGLAHHTPPPVAPGAAPNWDLPSPLPPPPPAIDRYIPGVSVGAEAVELLNVPRPVPPYTSSWWYFPEPVMVAAAVDWNGQPHLVWQRAPQDLLQVPLEYRGPNLNRHPAPEQQFAQQHVRADGQSQQYFQGAPAATPTDAPCAHAHDGGRRNCTDWECPQTHYTEHTDASWLEGQAGGSCGAVQHEDREPVTRTVYYEVKVEPSDDDASSEGIFGEEKA